MVTLAGSLVVGGGIEGVAAHDDSTSISTFSYEEFRIKLNSVWSITLELTISEPENKEDGLLCYRSILNKEDDTCDWLRSGFEWTNSQGIYEVKYYPITTMNSCRGSWQYMRLFERLFSSVVRFQAPWSGFSLSALPYY